MFLKGLREREIEDKMEENEKMGKNEKRAK